MKRSGGLFLVVLSAVSFAGCLRFRDPGPCYGVGCHAYSAPAASPSESAASPSAADQQTQNASAQKDSSAAKHSHGFHALLKKVKL